MKRFGFLTKKSDDNPLLAEIQGDLAKKDAQDFKTVVHHFLEQYKGLSEQENVTTIDQQVSLTKNLVSVLTEIVKEVEDDGLRLRGKEETIPEPSAETTDTTSGSKSSGREIDASGSGDSTGSSSGIDTAGDGHSNDRLKSVIVFKQANGRYRWLGIVSNNYTDRHTELITRNAHEKFVGKLKNKEVEYPVLRFHHIRSEDNTLDNSVVIGKSDYVEFDEQSGMLIASGEFLEEYDEIGENLSKSEDTYWGMSHGMPQDSIKRDNSIKNYIEEYIDVEFTLLETKWAANPLTTFM